MTNAVSPDSISIGSHTAEPGQREGDSASTEEVAEVGSVHSDATLAITAVKLSKEPDATTNSPVLDASRGASISTTDDPASDVGSVHSLPAVPVPRSHQDRQSQRLGYQARSSTSTATPPPSGSQTPSLDTSKSLDEGRQRHRSAAEVRSSNRLSGFFNHIMHRRDHAPDSRPNTRGTIHEDPSPATTEEKTESSSQIDIPARASTPPPDLPPPSLYELGLSLSVITSDLAPSHFSTPPSSGAFLAPHYLLLCHAQGLDVLPLVSPPLSQPYALVRRVSFKSVVVMEQRGVLVAIAGRRDGVRVYALEEVKKAVEWRIEVEVRRERDRQKRDAVKKIAIETVTLDSKNDARDSSEKSRKTSMSTPPPRDNSPRQSIARKSSRLSLPSRTSQSTPLVPRTPTIRRPKPPLRTTSASMITPTENPPPYDATQRLRPQSSSTSLRTRSHSVTEVLAAGISRRNTEVPRCQDQDSKSDWVESSDDEAINVVAAGSSGSQALDERTSMNPTGLSTTHSRTLSSARRSQRPADLDLSLSRSSPVMPPEPSPTPTLMSLRQALLQSNINDDQPVTPPVDEEAGDDDDDERDGRISLTQALMESRLPDLPPVGTRRSQQPILITASHPIVSGDDAEQMSTRASESSQGRNSTDTPSPTSRRRRWSVLLNNSLSNNSGINDSLGPATAPMMREQSSRLLNRSQSFRNISPGGSLPSALSSPTRNAQRPVSAGNNPLSMPSPSPIPPLPQTAPSIVSSHSSRSRFIPRIITNAFLNRRSDDPSNSAQKGTEGDMTRRIPGTGPLLSQAPPPKLEYVKLPGTKGALMVKAVETAKKSFLAILCGDTGEKVELFAGTYRTALGLSRTFILPDSPCSLELQLQGDDLVEVFLVFSQHVFGLEPATVRVREVRIGRAERRAARRRAREIRTGESGANDNNETGAAEEDTNVNVSIGVSVAVGSNIVASGADSPALIPAEHPNQTTADQASEQAADNSETPAENATSASSGAQTEELVALATAQMGPYTTFQQLSFAPQFPLPSIADEYVIPPTYPDFLEYRNEYEPESSGSRDLAQVQFSPPGLPVPTPTAPSRWYYRDPKNVVQGPWKASQMQTWYKGGLLPPDLPVRKEEDTEYMLLKDLRQQCVDPTHPFRPPPPPLIPEDILAASSPFKPSDKPLLKPISLLSQPRHFGPPALFFSSRGGHSTTIVDARGRSVLKGRFLWSGDPKDASMPGSSRMGDVRRLEAFDVKDRSVLVAMRQGGLEAVDLGDALLKPGDESRTEFPEFSPLMSNINRRAPFVWKIGTPVGTSASATVLSSKGKGHLTTKKLNSSISKSPMGKTEFTVGDSDNDVNDEVLFLGRKDDEIYICERNQGAFRILRLSPN